MCITIPSSANVKKARQWVLWQRLSETPLRLFSLGGLFLLAAIVFQVGVVAVPLSGWARFNLLFAVLPLFLLGPLLTYLPKVLNVTAVSYIRYVLLFSLFMASQLLAFVLVPASLFMAIAYLFLICSAWLTLLLMIRGMLTVSYGSNACQAKMLLVLLGVAGGVGVFAGAVLLLGWPMPTLIWSVVPLFLLAGLSLAGMIFKQRLVQASR